MQDAICEYFSINDDGYVSPVVVWEAGRARIKKQRLAKQHDLELDIEKLEREHKKTW